MNKLLQIVAVAALSLGLGAGGSSAVADESCHIEFTGPETVNVCKIDNETEIRYDCEIVVDIHNDNDQDAQSGDADSDKNTSGGGATSGDAVNYNDVSNEVIADCVAALADKEEKPKKKEEKPPKVKEEEKEKPRVLADVSEDVTPTPAALPVTGVNEQIAAASSVIGGLGVAALAGKLGLALYRRF